MPETLGRRSAVTISIGFYANQDTTVDLNDYGTKRPPLIELDNPGHWLTIGAFDTVPMADHLAFARKLADAATGYLAALERYAAQATEHTEAA
jgi:hypothetical protein